MDTFLKILQQQGAMGLLIFGIGFSVVTFALGLLVLVKLKIIKFDKKPANGKTTAIQTIKNDEALKEFIRVQMADTRKVVYEMKTDMDISQAKAEVTLQHLNTGISKMVDVMVGLRTDIAKALNDKNKS